MAETPEKHKELRTPIDNRIMLLILCFVIGFQSYLYFVGEEFGDFGFLIILYALIKHEKTI